MAKKTLDRSRPFATISSIKPHPKGACYEQDGLLFGQDDTEVGAVEGYKERKESEAKKAEVKEKATKKKAAADKAAAILGDLGDPNADAQLENAAAAAAEEKAADD